MKIIDFLAVEDDQLVQELVDFVPARVFDIHAHLFWSDHFIWEGLSPMLAQAPVLDFARYQAAMARWLPKSEVEGLFFGFPRRGNQRAAINRWVAGEVRRAETNNRALALVSPADQPEEVAAQIREHGFVGIKPYHLYASDGDTNQIGIEDFAPEWMWEICHGMKGVLMLHIMKDYGIAHPDNQKVIRRLCRKYPQCRLVLAHISRSFNYRFARKGLTALIDLDNVWVDTSAVTETESIRKALELLGPRRVLFGSDYPVSEIRGRCVAIHNSFLWVHPEENGPLGMEPESKGTLVGLESLLCLREACEDTGCNDRDVQDIFRDNALRLLAPHFEKSIVPETPSGPELWSEAWEQISGGTGLLSKRAELYDAKSWPSYFSKCLGSHVWDLQGRRYLDFTGGIGAVFLGYADPDVTRAVRRQLNRGTHCSLCTPDEVELSHLLLDLHPWAGRVRFTRGGGEALAVAVRIARAASGRSGIAFCGYHGWQDWYLAANLGDKSSLDGHLLPGLQPDGVPRELKGTSVPFKYNDFASFEEALKRLEGKFAGVVMEPMRSQTPKDGFLQKVAQRCRDAGGVFMVDEVTSGWRAGFPGALTGLNLEPDVVVYAKAMSNGFPCATIIGRQEIMDAANASFISSTYWTDGVGPAAALACIKKMRETEAQKKVWALGEYFQRQLAALAMKFPALKIKIEGLPCAPQIVFGLGADTGAAKQLLIRRMLSRGFLTSPAWYLMATHTEEQVNGALEALDATLEELSNLLIKDRLQDEAGPASSRQAMAQGISRLA